MPSPVQLALPLALPAKVLAITSLSLKSGELRVKTGAALAAVAQASKEKQSKILFISHILLVNAWSKPGRSSLCSPVNWMIWIESDQPGAI
jgi:hypothetical protein